MAGHSKFANTKHRKAAQDSKRNKIFTKLQREVYVAAKIGMPDPEFNPRLKLAISKAKFYNMPKDRIEGAIKKATGNDSAEQYDEIRYEGYGVAGVAVIVEALTDNRNRTASEVRTVFSKAGGALGESGSVSFMFDRIGLIEYSAEKLKEDELFEAVVEVGANAMEENEGVFYIECNPDELNHIRQELEKKFGEVQSYYLSWKPKNYTDISAESQESILKMIDQLEDSDDVQNVYTNCNFDQE